MGTEHDLIPPWTQLPNILMDYVIPLLRESEEKVLLYVLRRTYGFKDCEGHRKDRDTISFSQFLGGRVSSEGKPLDFGCGISRSKLVEALAFLQEIDLVQRIDKHAGKSYAGRGATGQYHLNLQSGIVQKVNQYLQDPVTARETMVQYLNHCRLIVQKMNQLRNESRKLKLLENNGSESEPIKNGSESEPEMVQKVNQQKKVLKKESPSPFIPQSTDGSTDGSFNASEPQKKKRAIPKSQEPGELHPTTTEAILAMSVKAFHCLANPTKLNEQFWDAQIALIDDTKVMSFFTCLKRVDAYWSGNPKKIALQETGLRKQMRAGIEIELSKAQRNLKGTQAYGESSKRTYQR